MIDDYLCILALAPIMTAQEALPSSAAALATRPTTLRPLNFHFSVFKTFPITEPVCVQF